MKNLARCLVMLMIMSVGSNVYAQNWVPYQEVVQTQTSSSLSVGSLCFSTKFSDRTTKSFL